MKYLFSFICLSLALTAGFACMGQCPSDKRQLEVTVSYGIISGDQLSNGLQESNKTLTYNSGAAFITARYFLYNRLAFGFSGGVATERGQYADDYNKSVIVSTYKQSIGTIAMELYYIYFFRKYLEVYTLFGIGTANTAITTFTNPTSIAPGYTTNTSEDGLKAQYTPIGVRFGGRFGAFAELGVGYKGVLNGGLSFKLGPSCWWKE